MIASAAGAALLLAQQGSWREEPPLPDPVGVAGAAVAAVKDGLLVLGGANFPAAMPWDGGKKAYHDRAFLLRPDGAFVPLAERLPSPRAYGACAATEHGLLLVGGQDGAGVLDEALLCDVHGGRLRVQSLPPLPAPRTNAASALVGAAFVLVGGQETPDGSPCQDTFVLDLAAGPDRAQWRRGAPLPGTRRGYAAACALGSRLLLVGGRDFGPLCRAPTQVEPLADAFLYDPIADAWSGRQPLVHQDGARAPWMAGALVPIDDERALLLGGDDGALMQRLLALAKAGDERARVELLRGHPGFSAAVFEWRLDAPLRPRPDLMAETPLPVTTPAALWRGRIHLVSGEVRPGVRTARVRSLPLAHDRGFGPWNWATLSLYLLLMAAIGFWCSRRVHSTDDFFLAGKRIPAWAAGLSIFGTQLSAITFMTIPAVAYADDWSRIAGHATLLVVLPIVALVFVPAFCRSSAKTAYGFLGERFSPRVQRAAALLFLLLQLGRMGVVLYLPALALATATGMSVQACILLMGVLCIVYTTMGGFEAVVWTDVAQVVVLLAGALLAAGVAIHGAGGAQEALALAEEAGRLRLCKDGMGLHEKTLPVLLLGTLVLNLIPYASDQTVVQRYLAVKDVRAARRSVLLNLAMAPLAGVLFFALGSALFAFYRATPGEAPPPAADQVVPWFVAQQLPDGLAGIVTAAIFAAAMSSLDSSMNSAAAVLHHDFGMGRGQGALRTSRIATLLLGAIGTGCALLVASADVKFVFDLWNDALGFFGGALCAVFVLAVLPARAGARAAGAGLVVGALAAAAASFLLVQREPPRIDGFLVGPIGFLAALLTALCASARRP